MSQTTNQNTATQPITPELRSWIVQQATAGHTSESVVKAMIVSGWQEDVAILALESTLEAHLASQPPVTAAASPVQPAALPAEVTVPVPALQDSPLYLDAGDRRVTVLSVLRNPQVVVFGNLLSDEECDALI